MSEEKKTDTFLPIHLTHINSPDKDNTFFNELNSPHENEQKQDSKVTQCNLYKNISADELKNRVGTWVDRLIGTKNIRLLAIDFDFTLVQVHTGGHWNGSAETLAAHVRPLFNAIVLEACNSAAFESNAFFITIVTYSIQSWLIKKVLKIILNDDEKANKIIVIGNDATFPFGCMVEGKQSHIDLALKHIKNHTNIDKDIIPSEIYLIDDDSNNITVAREYGIHAIRYPATELPNARSRNHSAVGSPRDFIYEAIGVNVVKRVQLPHGVLLCISQGSVVDFEGGAIVNAANTGGLGGGGVDGAISQAGGESLYNDRKRLPVLNEHSDRIPVGDARITGPGTYGRLRVPYVVHAVGPCYHDFNMDEYDKADGLLYGAYEASMRCSEGVGDVDLIAFSLISAGVFRARQSLKTVLGIAVRAVCDNVYPGLREVHLVGYTPLEMSTLLSVVQDMAGDPTSMIAQGLGGWGFVSEFINELEEFVLTS